LIDSGGLIEWTKQKLEARGIEQRA
jgi:hypothetical protein